MPLEVIRTWGYVVIFFSSFFESIPFLGLISPGATVAHVGGFFANQGELNIVTVLTIVTAGLIVGDFTAYRLGVSLGYPFLVRMAGIFSVEESRIERVRKFVHDHTGKSLTLGRFIFPVRVFAPFLAGVVGCKLPRFAIFSIAGSAFWGFLTVYIGFFFGYGFELVAPKVGRIFLTAVILGVLLILSFRSLRPLFKKIESFKIYAFTALVLSVFLLGKLIEDLVSKTFFSEVDTVLYQYVSLPAVHVSVLDYIFLTASFFFNSGPLAVLTVTLVAFLAFKRRWFESLLVLVTSGAGYVVTLSLKEILMLPRPPGFNVPGLFSYSFPSGHTSTATVFFLLIAYILIRRVKKGYSETLVLSLATLAILTVGFSRMYLGVHWFSDVLGGIAVGVLSFTSVTLLFEFGVQLYTRLSRFSKGRIS